jgi:hypothetical protein
MSQIVFCAFVLLFLSGFLQSRAKDKQWPFSFRDGKLEMAKLSKAEISEFKAELSNGLPQFSRTLI